MIDFLKEIALKVWQVGRLAVPGVAVLEGFRLLFGLIGSKVADWWHGLVEHVKGLIAAQLDTLGVDLAPPEVLVEMIAKVNVLIPLSEAWGYFLLYLGVASVLVGIKWLRNLLPSFS